MTSREHRDLELTWEGADRHFVIRERECVAFARRGKKKPRPVPEIATRAVYLEGEAAQSFSRTAPFVVTSDQSRAAHTLQALSSGVQWAPPGKTRVFEPLEAGQHVALVSGMSVNYGEVVFSCSYVRGDGCLDGWTDG